MNQPDPSLEQRNKPCADVRIPMRAHVRIRHLGDVGFFHAVTTNISESGILIATWCHTPVGTTVDMIFDLPGIENDVVARGVVVRAVDIDKEGSQPGIAVKFVDLCALSRAAIAHYVRRERI